MNKTKLISACCGLALLGGCASFQLGNDFNLTQFASQIRHGVTSQAEVKAWLGSPQSQGVVVDRDGEQLQRWLYYYSQGTLGNMNNARMKTLEVQFDQNGIVRSYNWSGQ
ncbi:MAG TPA: outer membrane protein assembly factor BamE [Candidatus Tenderia electrophaga]|uniref:Outer membrane protein assembly factor BamE n=1 Tax=Candidatus Tenderia electrophaga TaxID=1748243 RepID=A0A832N5X6_9GAMM|nr:outer membrane protein assembly factor BamE [Candidatus Tenderia electrophaga]